MKSILWLEKIGRGALAAAGGKGANLGEMAGAGLPVPPGFVVAAGVYRSHIGSASLLPRIAARLSGLDHEDLAAVEQASQEIIGWIEGASMPATVAAEISEAYRLLAAKSPSPYVAVRSSATAEDLPDASFAGQQETFLNLQGAEVVLEAVRRCWASLWAPRAVAYRAQMGYDHLAVDLAVVVQAMLPAEAAGVMFTANPLSGSADEMLVTASYGLGEAVVSGLVTPDTYVLHADGTVKGRTLGTKEFRIVPAGNGTCTEPVAADERARFSLADTDLRRLADLGRQVAAHYDAPQDIEWVLTGGGLFLLQARPITVSALGYVGPKLTRAQLRAYMAGNDNNLDHWPEPLKPLDAAFYRVATRGLGEWLNQLGAGIPADRRYYEELPDGRLAIRPLAPTPRLPMLWRAPRVLLRAFREVPDAAWPRLRAELLSVVEPLERADLAGLGTTALGEQIGQVLVALEREMPERFSSMFMSGELNEFCSGLWSRLALGKEEGTEAARHLLLALPYCTGEMTRATARLAGIAAAHGKDSPAFGKALAAFLAEWGTRPTRGMEALPSIPAWQDDPTAVLGLVDAMLSDPASMDAEAQERQQAAQFAASRDKVAARLNPLFRRWFLHSVEMARRYIVAREDSLLTHERAVAQIRRLALELGGRLVEAGMITAVDDVFFLMETELGPVARGELQPGERIAKRRRAYQQVLAAHLRGENWFIASGSLPEEAFPRRVPAGDALLSGIAASRGRVTGRVCIVRNQSEFGKLKKGEILVAPVTAPAWTPLFSVAAAVVTDVGGPLSHAAIVAREYGIPAVLGTVTATSLLQDGQLITVDGASGVVTA